MMYLKISIQQDNQHFIDKKFTLMFAQLDIYNFTYELLVYTLCRRCPACSSFRVLSNGYKISPIHIQSLKD